jgi:hypothetical protein
MFTICATTEPYGRYTLEYNELIAGGIRGGWRTLSNAIHGTGTWIETGETASIRSFFDDGRLLTNDVRLYRVAMDRQLFVGGSDYPLFSDAGLALDLSESVATVTTQDQVTVELRDGGFEFSGTIGAFPDSGWWLLAAPGGGAGAQCQSTAAHSGSNGLWTYTGSDGWASWCCPYQDLPAKQGDWFSAQAALRQPTGYWGTWVSGSSARIRLSFHDRYYTLLTNYNGQGLITQEDEHWITGAVSFVEAPAGTAYARLTLVVEKPYGSNGVSVAAFDNAEVKRAFGNCLDYAGDTARPEGRYCARLFDASGNVWRCTYDDGQSRDFTAYADGSLCFRLKTGSELLLQLTDAHGSNSQAMVVGPTTNAAGMMVWQRQIIPIALLTNVDLHCLTTPFKLTKNSGTGETYVDHIRWTLDPLTTPEPPLHIPTNGFRRIRIVGDRFYVDGRQEFICGSYYEYHPIGTNPWDVHPPDHVFRRQIRELKAAGFNAIRWYNTTTNALAICREEDMYVFIQFWIDQAGDFSDPAFRQANLDRLRGQVRTFQPYDDVIAGYLVMNEPYYNEAMNGPTIDHIQSHLREVRDMIKAEAPAAPVALNDWPLGDALDHSFWDFICFNIYDWSPEQTTNGIGYRPYVEWVKRVHAPDKPLVIMEYGGSVSPTALDEYGYGGWTEQEQADRSLQMLRDCIAAGCAGATYTHYADEWWNKGSNAEHDDHPEEWFGMLDLDSDGGIEMEGRWRPVYYAHSNYYRAFLVEPFDCATWQGMERVLLYSKEATAVVCRVDDGEWQALSSTDIAPWWRIEIATTNWSDGLHLFETGAQGPWSGTITNAVRVVVANESTDPRALSVRITPSSFNVTSGGALTVVIAVHHLDGVPVAGCDVAWGIFEGCTWGFTKGNATTGTDGTVEVSIPTAELNGQIWISAGIDVQQEGYQRRFGDITCVRVGM